MLLPNFWDSKKDSEATISQLNDLKNKIEKTKNLKNKIESNLEFLDSIKTDMDLEIKKLLEEDVEVIKKQLELLEIETLLNKPYDSCNAILEIHSGAGGTEACDWAEMLYRMYQRWCEKKGYKIEVTDMQQGDEAGIKSLTAIVKGINAYGYLKNEKGIHREEKDAEEIIDKALKLCDKYEKIFSRTLPESEIYALNHGTLPMEDGYYLLSEECAALIEKGLYYSELSGGAFDITIEPVSSLWDFTSGEKIVPDAETIAEKQACVGYEDVELKGNKLRFKKEGMGIELGAVAKGYIADKVKEYLVSEGVKSAVIDLGGNVLCVGEKPDGKPFKIGIQKPFADRSETVSAVEIAGTSVVSSGIYERYFEKDGKLYHHILDPATGYPYENGLVSVTVLSEESADGDGLSTACFALGLEKGLELIEQTPDTEAMFITEDGEMHFSKGFVYCG